MSCTGSGRRKRTRYYIVGDAQTQIEGPVRRDQIFARITKVKRKGRILQPGDFWCGILRTHMDKDCSPQTALLSEYIQRSAGWCTEEKTTENH